MATILVVEDGHEYIRNLERFLGDLFDFVRAGDGPAALEALEAGDFDLVFLDMRFDRATRFFGDERALVARFAGDARRARRFLEDNQGTYILAAIREAGHGLPAVMSYDFDSEPRRLRNLRGRYGPLGYLPDTAGPAEIHAAFETLLSAGLRKPRG